VDVASFSVTGVDVIAAAIGDVFVVRAVDVIAGP
jgi:hypothetical protein